MRARAMVLALPEVQAQVLERVLAQVQAQVLERVQAQVPALALEQAYPVYPQMAHPSLAAQASQAQAAILDGGALPLWVQVRGLAPRAG